MKPPDRSEEAVLKSDVADEKMRHAEIKSRALRALSETLRGNQSALVQAYEQAADEKRRK